MARVTIDDIPIAAHGRFRRPLRSAPSLEGNRQVSTVSPALLSQVLRLADPATADALAERIRAEMVAALTALFEAPQEAVERFAGRDGAGLRSALNSDTDSFLLRAAATGDPEVVRLLDTPRFANHSGFLSAILAAADPSDPRWYAADGLVPVVRNRVRDEELLPALQGPFPELVHHAVLRLGRELPRPVVLDACRTLAELGGAAEMGKLAEAVEGAGDELCHPGLAGLLRAAAAAPDPAAYLKERRPPGEWTDPAHARALLKVRLGHWQVERPPGLGWELILREHARRPIGGTQALGRDPLLALLAWEGCPEELVTKRLPALPWEVIEAGAPLPFEVVATLQRDGTELRLGEVIGHGVSAGWLPVERVLSELNPAREVLSGLPYGHEPTRRAVAGLVAPLGTDPVNWLSFYAQMGRAKGTAHELVAEAASPGSPKRCTTWPRPLNAVFPATAPRDSRAVFMDVLRCASLEAQIAVVPHLDSRAVQHFLVYGEPAPAVQEAIVAAHGVPALASYASVHRLPSEEVDRLLDLDEPSVDANVFRYCRIDRQERERLLAGRLRGGGTRSVPQELVDALDEVNLRHYRSWLIAGLESGDLGVARKIVGRLRLQTPAARLRLLIAVWERNGPDAVREILAMDRLPATLRRQTEKLLDAPDGLDRMRARLAEDEEPARLMTFLTKSADPGQQLHKLSSEGIPLPWAELTAAYRAGSPPKGLAESLAGRPDCPREMLLAELRATSTYYTGPPWFAAALQHGGLTAEDLAAHCAPAKVAWELLPRAISSTDPQTDHQAVLTALTDKHLGSDVEAWAVCLQLLPTFTGTLTELISTAGAVAQV
ncbi:hypothetical protein AB0D04_31675 [Streptomyces sp. NPDC048483]|uniref:hypothetical protein n=1 Tax=Streptomyces sp. NPDC048483 TaxID=3154927 RepID=UPI003443EB95